MLSCPYAERAPPQLRLSAARPPQGGICTSYVRGNPAVSRGSIVFGPPPRVPARPWGCMQERRLTYDTGARHTRRMATVGERFQLVIERDVRRRLGVRPGDRAVETIENGRLVITFLPQRHTRSLMGILAGQNDSSPVPEMSVLRDEMADMLAKEHRPQK